VLILMIRSPPVIQIFCDYFKGKSQNVQLSTGSKEIGTKGTLAQSNEDGRCSKRI
uniref:Uncharacterized protein n=1 Tax=Amphimedon queenslandica TaxID=400682 RepID=A0A1X7VPB2_AMPQE